MTVVEPNAAPAAAADSAVSSSIPAPARSTEMIGNTVATTPADPSAGAAAPAEAGAGAGAVEGLAELESYLGAQAQEAAPPTAFPLSGPLALRTRLISGRYRSPAAGFQMELRIDADGPHPLQKISGDYFSISGSTTSYYGSWTVDAVTSTVVNGARVMVGTARTTWSTTFTVAKVTVPIRTIVEPFAPATVQWSSPSGATGGAYTCTFESGALRIVQLEQDVEAGVVPFMSYATGSLPSGGPARTLDVAAAYREAGIQVLDTGGTNTIATTPTHIWNNASLHNAMTTHFSQFREAPQFKVWLLHAQRHELGTSLRGIMFDDQGLQRQGCASFYQMIQAGTPANLREQLYVNVHELGHCFNLFHSFHKSFMNPPLPNRPGALSWMNYPQGYNPGNGAPSGSAAFWGAFGFQFDDLELAHVRHGFRNNVIMGGTPFGTGAAFEMPMQPEAPITDLSGLRLTLGISPARPVLGTPIVLEITLTVERGQLVHPAELLHPMYGLVQVTISRPRGDVVVHRPPVLHCADPAPVRAAAGDVLPTSAYIGYDAAFGQIFEDPGTYRIQASYTSPEGSVIVSDSTVVRVWGSGDSEDARVAELLLRNDVGMAMTLLGTDSPSLADGMAALDEVVTEHGDHPAAVYARLALGINAARPFTAVAADGSVRVRDRDLDRADALLQPAIDASREDEGLDDLTVYQVLDYLARSHADAGDTDGARALRSDAIDLATEKNAPPAVLAALEEDPSE